MRQIVIVGIVVLGLGVAATVRSDTLSTALEAALARDARLMSEELRGVSPWLVGSAILSGLVLVAASARPRT